MANKTSLCDLLSHKGTRKWVQLHVDSAAEATAAVAGNVPSGAYPEMKHQLDMDDDAYGRFLSLSHKV